MTLRTFPLLLGIAAVLLGAALPAHAAPSAELALKWREDALALEHGHGVGKDQRAAIPLYCMAARAGDVVARYNLGWMYANGRGAERNDAYAAYFFKLAASQGDETSRNMLAVVGSETAKPPCVVIAEAIEAQETIDLAIQRAADTEAAAANQYQNLIETAQQRRIMAIVQRLAPQYGVHPGLAYSIIRNESNFNPLAVSDKNAQGLMQLIPATAARFRVKDPLDPEQNIRGGLSYLRWLLAYFKGELPLVIAAYNAGEGAVERFKGVPPYPETLGYLRRVQETFSLPEHPFDASVTAPWPELTHLVASKPRS